MGFLVMTIRMKRRQLLGLMAGTVMGGLRTAAAGPGSLALITNVSNGLTSLGRHELRRIFLGEGNGVGNQIITPFNLPPGTAPRILFDRTILAMTSDEIVKYWIDHRIRGQSGPPRNMPNPEIMVKIVARFTGALAYVPLAFVNATVRVVRLEGRLPQDPGYPIG